MQTITVIGDKNSADFENFLTKFTKLVNGWIFLGLIAIHLLAHAIEWGINASGLVLFAYSATASLWNIQAECREKKWAIADNGSLSFGLASFGLCLGAAILAGCDYLQMKPSWIPLVVFFWIIIHALSIRMRGSMMTWAGDFGLRK